ncbi:asparaginase domain-containing protein [Maribacter sp. CXY002]|uniref:asparaginase domain-containing protein n=1 Tax=Maribacter luteocoastalis TaxID=3407671 RepID=UPI003B67AD3A
MKLYLLYTGGTIGCVGTPLAPLQGPKFVKAFKDNVEGTITTQISGTTIHYDWFEKTLDSTNMQPSDWLLMANKIVDNYEGYDGFLILHGTDTMAFTSSALSFLLPNVSKPVIVSGSQLPLFFQNDSENCTLLYNTDALRNVLGAIEFATFKMPEVCLYFDDYLYRGNRVVKSNASEFTAFTSPNFPALGEYGVLPVINNSMLMPQPKNKAIDNHIPQVKQILQTIKANIDSTATIPLLMFPAYYNVNGDESLLVSMIQNIMKSSPTIKGLILEAYGEGNVPSYQQMQNVLKSIHGSGTVIVDCTQVYQGDVNYNAYATGAWLKSCGVISGYDMTAIAAITKLIVLNAQYGTNDISQIEQLMVKDLAGELTSYYSLSGYQNQFLSPGQCLYSLNGNYQFINNTTGSLILYDLTGTKPAAIWQKDLGVPGRLVMQSDCNLVFYNNDFDPIYASNTPQIGTNAFFQLENDGSLCIYDLYTNSLIAKIN